ncbi:MULTISPECIES: HAMP domain-containing sensor histidine kinase [unclassified Roseitalea]|uniref:sensor histidine kinase n=1 Tax=unclassified Roseitalea TaxID=2639107 RepID=UPI0027400EFB|nr:MULTISPECIES: HAMP domain-containing sensor histidine kinase [unclassified Roseitalea]
MPSIRKPFAPLLAGAKGAWLSSPAGPHRQRLAANWRPATVILAMLLAAVCAGAGVYSLVLGAEAAPPAAALAALISASLFGLVALAALHLPEPVRPAAAVPADPQPPARAPAETLACDADQPADAETLLLDRNGRVARAGPDLVIAAGEALLDRIHVGDRVAWLQALSSLRAGDCESASVQLRIDESDGRTRQSFAPARIALQAMPGGRVRARIAPAAGHPGGERGDRPAASTECDGEAGPEGERRHLAMVSHELRTPLNAIIGFSDLLRRGEAASLPAGRRDEYVDLIHGAAMHLLGIVNAILDVAKIEAGQYRIVPETFDLAETVNEAVALIGPQAEAKAIHLNVRPAAPDMFAIADRRAVKQVLINLLSNAVKFTPEQGCVTIDASVGADDMILTVADTGIGISAADLQALGLPFRQADNAYTRQCEGTGLGLALVKGLVELHGGNVRIDSQPDIGTKVAVTIPAARGGRETGHGEAAQPPAAADAPAMRASNDDNETTKTEGRDASRRTG